MIRTSRCTLLSLPVVLMLVGLSACNKSTDQSQTVASGNPADGNLAPVGPAESVAPQPTQNNVPPQNYAPPPQSASSAATSYDQSGYEQNSYAPAAYNAPSESAAEYQQPVEAPEPPPPLPEYSQPPCPGENYIWTPGYWAYTSGYYWVPGTWVLAPWVGALWTPPWWGFQGRVYVWHAGFWGPHIGFYGGINYGFGYTGRGYWGAYWNHGVVVYNRTVTNVNITVVHNFYNATVPVVSRTRVSYNGGRGGIELRPEPRELAVAHDPRTAPVPAQFQHAREAAANRAQFALTGRERPAMLAASRPLATSYRAPAPQPPEAAIRAAARPVPTPRALQPNEPSGAQPGRPEFPQNRVVPQQAQRLEQVPPGAQSRVPPERAEHGVNRPTPFGRPAEPPPAREQQDHVTAQRPPEARQEPAPRPIPQARPEFQRPEAPNGAPQARPEPRREAAAPPAVPQNRPEPPPRPQFQRPAPPAPEPQARPQFQRPAAPAPAPQARPEPQPRPAPQARPEPQPRPAPQARPEPQGRPAPQTRTVPQGRPEEKRNDR